MMVSVQVSTDRYRIVQNQTTLELEYYAFNQLVTTKPSDTRYTEHELFNLLIGWALEYQYERRELDE